MIALDSIHPLAECDSKEMRTQIHDFISSELSMFDSHTAQSKEDESIKIIEVILKSSLSTKKRRKLDFRDKRLLEQEFLQIVLYKVNVDTAEAINRLVKLTRKSHKAFSFAGTKDRRGLTTQRVTIWNGN